MPCSAAVGGADLGAHVAVLDGDVAHGIAHQTAQRSIVAARDGALDVEVADGGAIGIVERGAVALAGLQVERQRIALSVPAISDEPMLVPSFTVLPLKPLRVSS